MIEKVWTPIQHSAPVTASYIVLSCKNLTGWKTKGESNSTGFYFRCYSCSCNSRFLPHFLLIKICFWNSSSCLSDALPLTQKEKAKERLWLKKSQNCMNCLTQNLLNPVLIIILTRVEILEHFMGAEDLNRIKSSAPLKSSKSRRWELGHTRQPLRQSDTVLRPNQRWLSHYH